MHTLDGREIQARVPDPPSKSRDQRSRRLFVAKVPFEASTEEVRAYFTQFGENRLFENPAWDRDWFLTYARLYRPSAILCWSPKARGFCKANPDLVEIKDDNGTLMIGRVKGFGGAAIEGTAEVKATPGQLTVSAISGGVDGFAVLRYHSVPYLRAVPPIPWEEARLEGDPVPFIKLRTQAGPVKFEWNPRPGKAGGPGR